jgi:hypothetical protein
MSKNRSEVLTAFLFLFWAPDLASQKFFYFLVRPYWVGWASPRARKLLAGGSLVRVGGAIFAGMRLGVGQYSRPLAVSGGCRLSAVSQKKRTARPSYFGRTT